MKAVKFPEANSIIGPPEGMTEEHCYSIPAFVGTLHSRDAWDGARVVVVAWKPDEEDLKRLQEGGFVYINMLHGLCPHSLHTEFPFPQE